MKRSKIQIKTDSIFIDEVEYTFWPSAVQHFGPMAELEKGLKVTIIGEDGSTRTEDADIGTKIGILIKEIHQVVPDVPRETLDKAPLMTLQDIVNQLAASIAGVFDDDEDETKNSVAAESTPEASTSSSSPST